MFSYLYNLETYKKKITGQPCAPPCYSLTFFSARDPFGLFPLQLIYQTWQANTQSVVLMAFIQWGSGSPSGLWHIRLTNSHKTCKMSMLLTGSGLCVCMCVCARLIIINYNYSVSTVNLVTDVQCDGLTLFCIVFSFMF